jgi:hypothetical protein
VRRILPGSGNTYGPVHSSRRSPERGTTVRVPVAAAKFSIAPGLDAGLVGRPVAGGVSMPRRPLLAGRVLQVVLGIFWLLDGALQLQRFMFTRGFAETILKPQATGQPGLLAAPILFLAHLVAHYPVPANAGFALTQLGIGAGLLFRRSVRPALVASFAWVAGVWVLGEGAGGILTGTASPLTGAPGAVLVYGILGALAWPSLTASGVRRVARGAWATLWCGSALLWVLPANRAAGAVQRAVATAAQSAPGVLRGVLAHVASAAAGDGLAIALTLAAASLLVGLGVYARRPAPYLLAGVVLATGLWVAGQSAGGLLTGQATDPNIGPLFVLLGLTLLPRMQVTAGISRAVRRLVPAGRALPAGRVVAAGGAASSGRSVPVGLR